MKSEERRAGQRRISPGKYLVDLLLLLVNSIGMAGALTEILEIPWQEMGKNSVSQAGAMDFGEVWFFFVRLQWFSGAVPAAEKC